jgi:hypothetical protein
LYTETKYTLNVFQNRILRKEFGREKVEEGKKSVNKGQLPTLILHIILQVLPN